jgi:hypothetical protein
MTLPRLHAVELHELPGCPSLLRRIATDYLRTVGEVFHAFEPVLPLLGALLTAQRTRRIVDLCSGAGGPIVGLAGALEQELGFAPEVVLTDLHPNREAFAWLASQARVPVSFEQRSVDARAVPEGLVGVRTIFDAFHHFRPEQARGILADAAQKRVPLLVVEATERSLPAMLGMLLLVPVLVLVLTPFVRPFSFGRLLLTYVIPLAVPLIVFDGIVSCWRSYTPNELRQLCAGLDGSHYGFRVSQLKSRGARLTCLVGSADVAAGDE